MLDLSHIHDILVDAKDSEGYSPEARESARLFAEALNNVYRTGYLSGQQNPTVPLD